MATVAPHACIACGAVGSVLCKYCMLVAGSPPPPRCAGCRQLSEDYRTCRSCRKWLDIYAVHVAGEYEGLHRRLLESYKFGLQREAADYIATIMMEVFPDIGDKNVRISAIPTASSRIRLRGFDHAGRLAERVFAMSSEHFPNVSVHTSLFARESNSRQMGSSRSRRVAQMSSEFSIQDIQGVKGSTYILIDDVMTTGASLAAAARLLKTAGAKRVYALVYAQKV